MAEGAVLSRLPRLLPPRGLLIALAALGALHVFAPLAELDPPLLLRGLGALLVLACVALAFVAAGRFSRVGTGIVPFSEATTLVVEGPFRFSRNPMYLAMVGVLVGLALASGSLSVWIVPLTFWCWLQTAFVRHEEAFMATRFGAAYEDYRRRVRRWL
ncbi:MAG: isoprenylcysteine carboxylmethyltransferase family protein [Pseudomonadales bacterium]|nr:isoprenylcysteine carboxylmethyltransferase family protein [Pseudomonadales bacterium]